MQLTINVSDVDYDSLVELLLPMLQEQMGDTIWTKMPFLTKESAIAILAKMSTEKKDSLLVTAINRSGARISHTLEEMAGSKGVRLTVSDVKAKLD